MAKDQKLVSRADLARLVANTMAMSDTAAPIKYVTNQIEYLVRKRIVGSANKPTRGQALLFEPFECALVMIALQTGVTSTVSLEEMLISCRQEWVEQTILECATRRQGRAYIPHLALSKTYIGEDCDPEVKGIPEPVAKYSAAIVDDLGITEEWLLKGNRTAPYLAVAHVNLINLRTLLAPLRKHLGVSEEEI